MTTGSTQEHATFRIAESRSDAQTVGLVLSGQLDSDAAPILASDLEARLARGVRTMVLDLDQVDFISSSGVGSLVVSVSAFRSEGGDIVLQRVSNSVFQIFEMLGLTDFLSFEQVPGTGRNDHA